MLIEDSWDDTLEFFFEEAIVRSRMSDEQINQVASELKLDLKTLEAWSTLEQLSLPW